MSTNYTEIFVPQQLQSVKAASTAALTVTYSIPSNGNPPRLTNAGAKAALSLDDFSPSAYDRVLIKDQSSAYQNGIYRVLEPGDSGTNWVLERSRDFNSAPQVIPGLYFTVEQGTKHAGDIIVVKGPRISEFGVSDINFKSADEDANLAEGNLFVGNSSGVAAAVDFSTDAQIGVGDGTTFNSVAMSGEGQIDNAGAFTLSNKTIAGLKVNSQTNNADDPGVQVAWRVRSSGGGSENIDITVPFDVMIDDFHGAMRAAGDTSDTVRLINGTSTNFITDSVDLNIAAHAAFSASVYDDTHKDVSAAATLRVAITDNSGSDLGALDATIIAWRDD